MDLWQQMEANTTLKKRRIGFISAACSLAAVYAASSAPIPLYTLYQKTLGFTKADFSWSAVSYFAGTVISLLILARISNHLGRRPVVLATLGLTILGCLVFVYLHNVPMFLLGRFIQGLACGLASSSLAAYIEWIRHPPHRVGWGRCSRVERP